MRLAACYGVLVGAVGGTAGCNSSGLDLAPVTGVVTLDGQPVADAGLYFTPVDAKQGPPAVGTTDAEGVFSMITANQEGAVVGEHRVAVSKDESTAIPQSRGFPLYKLKHHIPEKYGDGSTSGLTATVVDDDNHFEFKLSSK
jgi:hypothetical protein